MFVSFNPFREKSRNIFFNDKAAKSCKYQKAYIPFSEWVEPSKAAAYNLKFK